MPESTRADPAYATVNAAAVSEISSILCLIIAWVSIE